MDESVEGISMTENIFAAPGSSIDIIRVVMDQAVQGPSVIKNIDDDILEITTAPSSEVFEIVEKTAEDVTMTESLVATTGLSREGIGEIVGQIAEVKMENREAIVIPSTEEIGEIMDQEAEVINVIGNLAATAGPSIEGVNEAMDRIAEDFKLTENLKATAVSGTEMFIKIMDLDEVGVTDNSLIAAPGSSPEGINEIMNQTTEYISVMENIEATPVPNTDRISEISDEISEGFGVTKNLKATAVSGTEVFTEVMDLHKVCVTESLVAAPGSSPEGINELLDQTPEDIRVMENIEATPLPNTDRIGQINDKIAEGFGVNLEATAVSSPGVNEAHVQNGNTANIMFVKEMSNMEKEAEDETSKTMNSEAKNLKNVYVRKGKGRKRKIAHPPISVMLMSSIKSLKKSSGVSFEDIKTYMEVNYSVNVKALFKYHVINYLQKWVEIGILEKVNEVDMGERFRIKESEISYGNDCIIQFKKIKIN